MSVRLFCALLCMGSFADSSASTTDAAVRALATQHEAVARPSLDKQVPTMTAPTVWLGRELFFAKSLSLEGDVACVSCHHPSLAGGDALSLPIGTAAVDPDLLGPGRVYDWRDRGKKDPHAAPGPNVARNSPTVFNVGLYERALFHDGRVQKKRRGGFRSPESARDSGRDMLGVQARLPVA